MGPKIEYDGHTVAITLSDSSDIVLGNTVGLEEGMRFDSLQLGDCEILEILNTTSFKINKTATSDWTESVYVRKIIEFEYPPQKDDTEKLKVKKHERVSLAGVRQVSVDYIEMQQKFDFDFLPIEKINEIKNFYLEWASLGKSFFYFPDKDSAQNIEYEARTLDLTTKRTTYRLFKVSFFWRRLA